MSLDDKKWLEQSRYYPEACECVRQSTCSNDALPSYKYLFDFKGKIPKELYAYLLRKLLTFNTANVSVDLRLKMLEGVDRADLMYLSELKKIQGMPERITVYRGSTKTEHTPGLSWSLRRYIAESSDFHRGRIFIASIKPSDIICYFSYDVDEEEIIAFVTDEFEIIDD